ncbi:MAG: 5-(carboxyamino)imidazole ribonucleotide mutase [Planctomycetota bacterium]|nr:5-(carboxyamino)imidazole ribonucleotide mutase [Planctomycetota bacterium]
MAVEREAPAPRVGILLGSDSDTEAMQPCAQVLEEFAVPHEVRVISAHRTPAAAHEYATTAADRGLKVLIAAAGGAAHLAGVLAGLTPLPVIGVPIRTGALGGLDSLLSTVQMPRGVPVATVAIGKAGPVNAAVLAVQILAVADPDLRRRLIAYKARLAEAVTEADAKVRTRHA